jgi:transcriptional regulator with XRE-family HTH domain
MTTDQDELSWKELLYVQFARQNTTMEGIIRNAAARGLRLNRNTASKILRGDRAPTERFIAAVSIVLNVHPEALGFERNPVTELGFRAFEWEFPEQDPRLRIVRVQ